MLLVLSFYVLAIRDFLFVSSPTLRSEFRLKTSESHAFVYWYHTMLIGEYTHTLDDKNRLSLPSKFRQEMGKKVFVTPGLDGCLFVFTGKEWGIISEKLSGSSMLQSDARSFNRFMFAGAEEASVDSIGRILLPDFLKKQATLDEKVVIIGVKDRLEIWDEKKWFDYKKGIANRADTLAEKLGSVGIL